jgi:hypothetical protein
MTPRRPIGVHRGEGGSHRESSLLPICRLRVIYDSQPQGNAIFLAIRISVKGESGAHLGLTQKRN